MDASPLRNRIDERIRASITKILTGYGVESSTAAECADQLRFHFETRAVLLNRVTDHRNYYLSEIEKDKREVEAETR